MASVTDSIADAYWQMPAIARTATTMTVVLSISTLLGLFPGGWLIYHPWYLWKIPPQIWRLVTCFCLAGPQLGLLFDPYFLYRYMSQLEVGNARFPRKVDLIWYLMFVSSTILVINYFVDLPVYSYISALILALAYTATQDQRGMKSNFYFITIPAQMTPICMILINLLFPGGHIKMMLELEGLVAAHLFDFLSRTLPEFGGAPNVLATPKWLDRIVKTPRILQRGFGTAIRPADQAVGGGGPLPESWKSRGKGQRLG